MKTFVKFGVLGALAMGAFALVGCGTSQEAKNKDANMGAVSGDCSKGSTCCSKEKAASMGAVSGEKGCCAKDAKAAKGSMGMVSGECTKGTTCTKGN